MTQSIDDTQFRSANNEPQDDEIDLRDLLATLIEGKWLIAVVTALALAMGLGYLLVASPVYRADALIQVEGKDGGLNSAFGDMAALLGQQTAAVSGEIEILRSRMVVGQAVANLRLDIAATPDYFPLVGEAMARRYKGTGVAAPWLGLGGYSWGGEAIAVATFEVPSAFIGETFTLVLGESGRYELLSPEGEPVLNGQIGQAASAQVPGGELKLFVTDLQGRPGTRFELTRRPALAVVSGLQRDLGVSEKGKQSNIIGLSLQGTDRALTTAIVNEIANIYVRQNVERKSAEAQKTLEFLDRQLPQLKQELQASEAALNNYRNQKGSVDLDKEAGAILEQMVKTEQNKTLLKQKREELIGRFTPAHPAIIAVDAQIAELNAVQASLEKQVKSLPQTQQEILRLARDAQVNTELYTALLNNYQQLQVAKAGTVGNVRIVDYAAQPIAPIKPKRPLVAVLSLGLGLFLGVSAVFLWRALRSGVEDPDLLERQLGISVYATVPHSRVQKKISRQIRKGEQSQVLAVQDPEEAAVESLRNLRTALHFAALGAKNKVLMITGPAPGIGKSFISVNLAAVMASAGAKVLLIDADMRKGYLHQYLGLGREKGLSNVIGGTLDIGAAIHKTAVSGLDFMPTGALPPNPAELLLHERFSSTLEALASQYDHVVIDSPPVLAVTDAAIVGRLSGTTLLVVKAGAHPMREIEQAVKRLKQAGVNLRGLLFNDVKVTSNRYGYKYSYQYSYKKS